MKSAFFIVVLCFAASVSGQKSGDAAYKIRAVKGGAAIGFKGIEHRLNLSAQTDAARVTETALLFAAEKNGFRYLVIDVSGWSREKQNDRQCGAGVESNLIWIKLDAKWKIRDIKSARYQSCWSGTELSDAFEITKNALRANFDNIREQTSVNLFYDANEPEKGFQITQTPLTKN